MWLGHKRAERDVKRASSSPDGPPFGLNGLDQLNHAIQVIVRLSWKSDHKVELQGVPPLIKNASAELNKVVLLKALINYGAQPFGTCFRSKS